MGNSNFRPSLIYMYYASLKMSTSDFQGGQEAQDSGVASISFIIRKKIDVLSALEVLLQ